MRFVTECLNSKSQTLIGSTFKHTRLPTTEKVTATQTSYICTSKKLFQKMILKFC